MNIVLYSHDFEPITVLNLPMWLLDKVETEGYVKVAQNIGSDLKEKGEQLKSQTDSIMNQKRVATAEIDRKIELLRKLEAITQALNLNNNNNRA